ARRIYYRTRLQKVPEITQTLPLSLQIISTRNPRKKTQKISLELNLRFFLFLSQTFFFCTEVFNIHSLFIGFPLAHPQNTHHEIIYRFGSN
ncbi:hypothetical protein GIB67_014210, partial [Kingdonia uniflora]